MIVTYGDILTASLNNIWLGIVNFLPTLLAAIFITIVGFIIGSLLFKVIEKLIKVIKLDKALKATGVEKIVEKAGLKLNSGYFFGKLVEWFCITSFLVAALDILGLTQATSFLSNIALVFLPQVVIAVAIILIAAIVAEAMQKVVIGAAKATGMKSVNFVGNITKWAIWIFAILVAITQLGIAVSFINTLFTGIVIAISLALGLAFGFGGQDAAASFIEKIKNDFSDK